MEAVLMQQTAAAGPARRRCVGKAALAGNGWQVVRLAGMARCANWGVRARPGLARAQLVAERRDEIAGEAVEDDDDDARAMRLFVGLPADVVSPDGTAVNRPRAIRAGLRALKLLGVDGVELPVSWAVVQPGSEEQFEWTGYLAVADMVRDAGLSLRLGPDGELRYPSYPPGSDCADDYAGGGEFQCYDKHMLARLKQHADTLGRPLWGLAGPHDAPRYDDPPESSGFFKEPWGSWQTEYGKFFLSWYAGELLAHGDRVLTAANRALAGKQIELSAKVPFLRRRSRPAQATAGLHGGYGPVAEMFARHDCTVLVSGMTDAAAGSEAEELLAQIKDACTEHGARLAYESVSLVSVTDGAGTPNSVWGDLLAADRTRPCHFTYQRMGAEFFSPDHWPLFVQFTRDLEFPEEAHEDDLAASDGEGGRLAPLSGRVAQSLEKEAQMA